MLISREYPKNIINSALEKAKNVSRQHALEKVAKKENDMTTLVITFHPKLPSVSGIVNKHWKTLTKDPALKDIFPQPPMVAFKQPPNLKRMLCHAKIPVKVTSHRNLRGMNKCIESSCSICPFVKNSKEIHSTTNNENFPINGSFDCQTTCVVYLITCQKCKKQYVGQTGRQLKNRIQNHIYYTKQNKETTGSHFNLPGHSQSNISVQVIEKVFPNTPNFRLEREDFWIKKINTTFLKGLNKYE